MVGIKYFYKMLVATEIDHTFCHHMLLSEVKLLWVVHNLEIISMKTFI